MASTLMTPGVYIEEKNAFPSSVVAVETAVPVFIGYTEKAERFGKSLLNKPTRITSFAEFVENFGGGFHAKFTIAAADPAKPGETFMINGAPYVVTINPKNTVYLFNSIRLFYANGGSNCYIVSVGTYGDKPDGIEIAPADFIGSDTKPDIFELLKKEFEPTLVVIPDAIALGADAYGSIYTKVLGHCRDTQSRFGIFDLAQQSFTDTTDAVVKTFRDKIGVNALNYGAAYYPWLKTAIVQASEISFENLDATVDLEKLLPETAAQKIVQTFKGVAAPDDNAKKNYHQSLKAASPTYNSILEEVRSRLNELPPSGAIAGLYTMVDNNRGVWKSPANVSINMVNAPAVNISNDEQKDLNVDVMAGKSINVIRPFPGIGVLVWGGRTLDGNSQDWRYINVRRTLIMIEQSIKLAARAYVFEPNDGTTWVTVKSMINNFLNNLWKQGALAGAAPETAYDVQIGLGTTMTPQDILDGKMLITVKVAIVRPAEFIVITFQQQMQQS
ncbi:phage tail sheath C-terminal domain-containing protein [Chitinophaga sp.]|uniref:phage tail sheath family protein n=1 Tax=Chitinophaga sp. TaxID=1869181 RepID=UPI0031CEC8E5